MRMEWFAAKSAMLPLLPLGMVSSSDRNYAVRNIGCGSVSVCMSACLCSARVGMERFARVLHAVSK